MNTLLKADFHLHTCYSDNQDKMQPEEYAALARQAGYGAIGFCDHHHNLTQASWHALRSAAEALSGPDLLITTGYEATFVTGHLCVLDKMEFDGATAAQCAQQMWRTDNLRVVAHPDNNNCAWRLPLPVEPAGVEVINGGQDLYAFRAESPCNGLHTYQRYLLLNQPVAAFGQSDCHARAIFGRAWTGIWLPEGQSQYWPAVRAAVATQRTFAAMGEITLDCWQEQGHGGGPRLCWATVPEAEIWIYCADRPVTWFAPGPDQPVAFEVAANGLYWVLARRGLAWAVSSPVCIDALPGDGRQAAARRTALLAAPLVNRAATTLQFRLDQVQAYEAAWPGSALPVARYVDWLRSLLPAQWATSEFGDEAGELHRRARLRLQHAQSIAGAVLEDVLRVHYGAGQEGSRGVRVALLPSPAAGKGGVLQFTVEVPRSWRGVRIADAEGTPLAAMAMPIDGERDPIHGARTRDQVVEVVTWLQNGEMHEYAITNVDLTHANDQVTVAFDLYPARFAGQAISYPHLAAELEALRRDPAIAGFFVSIRMPQRFGILAHDATLAARRLLVVHDAAGATAGDSARPAGWFAATLAADDFLGDGIAVQVS